MSNQFTPHKMSWDQASIARFWDHQTGHDTDNYFSLLCGDAILDFVQKSSTPLQGNVVDYGCGPGFLMEKLMQRGIACSGVDYSEKSITTVQEKVGSNPLFQGAKLIDSAQSPIDENYADALFFIETIEHILDADMDNVLSELYRVTKPGGYVIVTTPHKENLEAGEQQCPDCGCQFHYMQHVQSWTVERLSKLMEKNGFTTSKCQATKFRMQQSKLNWIRDMYCDITNQNKPHLIYIGQKPTV